MLNAPRRDVVQKVKKHCRPKGQTSPPSSTDPSCAPGPGPANAPVPDPLPAFAADPLKKYFLRLLTVLHHFISVGVTVHFAYLCAVSAEFAPSISHVRAHRSVKRTCYGGLRRSKQAHAACARAGRPARGTRTLLKHGPSWRLLWRLS